MAGISSSIQLADRMTPVLQSITTAMNMMVGSMTAAQTASDVGFNPEQALAMQLAVAGASAQLAQYQEELENVKNTPVAAPDPPEWNSVSNQPVFMTSGAERFESEYQAAAAAAQQLIQNQKAISGQAVRMKAVPPGMINDVATTEIRMQSLTNRIQKLNSIPVKFRTEQTNNELEALRGKLSQAVNVQGQLNAAMGRMDISATNAAYQQLNSIMDSTERDIRENFSAQEQFNRSVKGGQSAAGGLESSIKRYAAMLISAATAGKAISLADQVTQTTARLDLMNYGLDTTEQLQQKIFQSAQRSRGAYQTTADAVAKLGMQARGAFSSNDELIAFAEQLNKSFVIAGTSAQGVDSVMLQLTQSMASGKLQGEELNAVLDNAQPIVQNIADYMGVPVGQIKKLASDGAISAEIIKNAMFAAADETNAKFEKMPLTFGQVANNIKNQALMAFQPALQQLSAVTQTEGFSTLTESVTSAIQTLAGGAVQALNLMGQAAVFVQENWSWLSPVIGAVAGAILGYNLAAAAQVVWSGLATAATVLHTLATQGLTAALLACPLVWVALAIGAVVAGIVAWVNHVGGLKVAWLTCVNTVLSRVDMLKLGFTVAWNAIQNGIDTMQYGFEAFKAGVLNAIGNLKVKGLTLLQDFINGAIDRVNAFIETVNQIAGTSIETVAHVEFATSAAVEEEANQKQRAADLAALKEKNAADKQDRQQQLAEQQRQADRARMERQADIAAAKAEAEEKKNAKKTAEEGNYNPEAASVGDIAGNTGKTAANTAAIADSMDIMDEYLKYMRDAAEQEIINRFTLAELKVDVNNNNTLTKKADFEDLGAFMNTFTSGVLAAAAEGGHI